MAGELPTNREVADRLRLIGDLLELEGAVRHRVLAYRRAAARIRSTHTSVAEMAMRGPRRRPPRHRHDPPGEDRRARRDRRHRRAGQAARPRPGRPGRGRAPRRHRPQAGRRRSGGSWASPRVDDVAVAIADGRVRDVAGLRRRDRGAHRDRARPARRGRGRRRGAHPASDAPCRWPRRSRATCARRCRARGSRWPAACGAAARARTTSTWSRRTDRPEELQAALAAHPAVERELSRGDASSSVADPRRACGWSWPSAPPEAFGNLLQHATGSAAHNIRLRELAVRQGLSVSQHGIARARRRPGRARRRGGGLRGPRAPPGPAGAARGPGRDRGGARGPAAAAGRRAATCGATCTRTRAGATARATVRPDGRGRPGARLRLPGDQRPLAEPRHGRRPRPRPGAPPVGGDRRARTRATTTSRC